MSYKPTVSFTIALLAATIALTGDHLYRKFSFGDARLAKDSLAAARRRTDQLVDELNHVKPRVPRAEAVEQQTVLHRGEFEDVLDRFHRGCRCSPFFCPL